MISVPPGAVQPWLSITEWTSSTSRLMAVKLTLGACAWKGGRCGNERISLPREEMTSSPAAATTKSASASS